MALVTLRNVTLQFGWQPLFDRINCTIDKGQRIALIGRNGEGKTSLIKIIQGELKPDGGEVDYSQGITISTLMQSIPEHDTHDTVFDIVAAGLGDLAETLKAYQQLTQKPDLDDTDFDRLYDLQQHIENNDGWQLNQQVETAITKLKLDSYAYFNELSGGVKRRVLLAQALVSQPDLLLLDEPTNHLDIDSIQWLEQHLKQFNGSILFITHDRQFLKQIATDIIELERGELLQFPGDYERFLEHKAEYQQALEQQQAEFDKKLAQEEAWIRQGVKARRKRNEGRVRNLQKMREQRKQRREQQGQVELITADSDNSGKRVIEAHNISYAYNNQVLFKNFSTKIMRGDTVAIIGPNGCGKTTLINVLLGHLEPQQGSVEHGTQLHIAYFDQLKADLDDEQTAQDNVGEGRTMIDVDGKSMHVLSYLQRFMFSPQRARCPIKQLSGGERSRLMLAKLLSKPHNLLVLDEPTNDLDLEMLEILEDWLVQYSGTVLLVSHDRDFINNVATNSFVFEPNRPLQEYVGGYDDWLQQRPQQSDNVSTKKVSTQQQPTSSTKKNKSSNSSKLSYQQRQQLKQLPQEIEHLEDTIQKLHETMSDPSFYQQSSDTITEHQTQLKAKEAELERLYTLWEQLEAKQNS